MSRLSREVITELSVMKIYLNSHKQRLGVTSLLLSARLLSLGTLDAPPPRAPARAASATARDSRALSSTISLHSANIIFTSTSVRFI